MSGMSQPKVEEQHGQSGAGRAGWRAWRGKAATPRAPRTAEQLVTADRAGRGGAAQSRAVRGLGDVIFRLDTLPPGPCQALPWLPTLRQGRPEAGVTEKT